MTQLLRRDFRPEPASYTELSFVADIKVAPRKKRRSFWNVPQTDDYGHACTLGMQYACEFVQFLKDNPSVSASNVIGKIVSDIAAHPHGTAMDGYAVGFWSAIEKILFRGACLEDHWDMIQSIQDRYDGINAARETEKNLANLHFDLVGNMADSAKEKLAAFIGSAS